MTVNISFWGVLIVIFAGLFMVIDTRHNSKHHSHRNNLHDWEDWEEDGEPHHHQSGKHYYSSEEEYRPKKHHHRKNDISDSDEEYKPKKPHRNIMDVEGRAAKPLKPIQTVDECRKEGLKLHNEFRAAHGVPALQFDDELNSLALDWAKEIGDGSDAVKKIVLSHTPEMTLYGGVGDNIFACKCYDLTCERSTQQWYDEEKKYNYSHPHYHWTWGHFSQVVWKETTKFGMAKYTSPIMKFVIVVATYTSRANRNYTKDWRDNVLPPIKSVRAVSGAPVQSGVVNDPPVPFFDSGNFED